MNKTQYQNRHRQLLREEKALLKIVPLAERIHQITRQHKKKVERK